MIKNIQATMKAVIFASLAGFLIWMMSASCDKIEPPYMVKPISDTSNVDTVRKVLIEDFTGHRCGNCPRAHETLEGLIETKPGRIVSLAIHADFFAAPLGTSYPYDFRTPEGTELATSFVASYPSGMVNRKSFGGNVVLSHETWASALDPLLELPPEIWIDITNNFNAANRQLTVQITAKFLVATDSTLMLSVFMDEDSIISKQIDYSANPQDIPNYIHRHALRGSLNGTWGDILSSGHKAINQTITKNFTYTVNNAWAAEHCSITAFVYNKDSKVVIQAERKKIK